MDEIKKLTDRLDALGVQYLELEKKQKALEANPQSNEHLLKMFTDLKEQTGSTFKRLQEDLGKLQPRPPAPNQDAPDFSWLSGWW